MYNRPVYTYNEGLENVIQDEDQLVLIYTGSRWFGALYEGLRHMPVEFWTSVATGNIDTPFSLHPSDFLLKLSSHLIFLKPCNL